MRIINRNLIRHKTGSMLIGIILILFNCLVHHLGKVTLAWNKPSIALRVAEITKCREFCGDVRM